MTTTTRTAALGVFAATLAAVLAFGIMPRSVMAHSNHQATLTAGPPGELYLQNTDQVVPFFCVFYSIQPDRAHALPGWSPPQSHGVYVKVERMLPWGGWQYITHVLGGNPSYFINIYSRRSSWQWQATYRLTPTITMNGTHYGRFLNVGSPITVNTGAKPPPGTVSSFERNCPTGTPTPPTTPPTTPPEPETPDTVTPAPETPTPPTTPDPEAPACTYKHRVIGVYGARTTNTYSAEVLVSSEVKGARIEIRAYQGNNGTELDVLDRNGSAVGPNVTLGAANTLRGFRPEGAAGRHTVIVKHPTKAAMDNATVALQLRGPEVGYQVVPVPGIEHCTTASTTTE